MAGKAVSSLDGGDGAFHVARHQKLCELQQTVAEYKKLQRRRRSETQGERVESHGNNCFKKLYIAQSEVMKAS